MCTGFNCFRLSYNRVFVIFYQLFFKPLVNLQLISSQARSKIRDIIDQYIHEQIDVAGKAICNTVKEKIMDGDVVLTYGWYVLILVHVINGLIHYKAGFQRS